MSSSHEAGEEDRSTFKEQALRRSWHSLGFALHLGGEKGLSLAQAYCSSGCVCKLWGLHDSPTEEAG